MTFVSYDRAGAVAYADRWALYRNPNYYDFDQLGGDCTNFVSQCIHAGGMPMNFNVPNGWFFRSLSSRAPAWTGVVPLFRFLTQNAGIGPFASVIPLENALPGDVIQLGNDNGWYHSLLILDPSPFRIYVAAHTIDSVWRPLDTYRYQYLRCLHIEGGRMN